MPYVDYKKVQENREYIAREDRPLFSTDLIHNARVLSVWWYVLCGCRYSPSDNDYFILHG